jgi:hypothetical protein
MQQQLRTNEDQEVFISVESTLKQLFTVIPSDGGRYTVDALAQKLKGLEHLSAVAKRNLVRRMLEISVRVRARKAVPMFIGIRTVSGKLTTRRPYGVSPVGDAVIFAPDDPNE